MDNVVVIGAGITGITTAYYLARAGYSVTVVDENSYPGMKTSYANGGQFSVSNSEVWTTAANIKKGLKWITTQDAPLLVRPWPSLAKVKWLSGFLYHTAKGDYLKNTELTIQMALAARLCYDQIQAEENISFDFSQQGILHFYKNYTSFESACAAKSIYDRMGVKRTVLTAAEVCDLEPSLEHTNQIVGGIWTESDAMGDIHKFCVELAKVCAKKYQVKFMYDRRVIDINVIDNNRIDITLAPTTIDHKDHRVVWPLKHLVICGGASSSSLAKMTGDSVNVYPVKGYSITVPIQGTGFPMHSLLDDDAKIVTSTLGNRLRIAGTAELDDWNLAIRPERIEPLVAWAKKWFPNLNYEHVNPWAGLRPMTPNMMPIVRRHKKYENVWFNTGHGHLGWTLGAGTARDLAQRISHRA